MIDGKGTGIDYIVHAPAPAGARQTGDAVYTGQQIGEVGDTGDAVGCHLHFEEWTRARLVQGRPPLSTRCRT